ncbi:hypothetical protein TVAG_077150 [Trichomonas vaginalis G3]|uniref:Uncharacterized protein n=1 Tax=Trichomonas vaginalis (strain ATCC PRA-98 / G3) TaxID=412133 RepID=A2D9W2_TRIV3|nr:hypothetical protein TVAGG3_0291160 [Trichomonas vaginalis G3]EAY22968.1 hypothetical protein TVAG_077150 [Trichomonas vaginalis G3]KAI5527280.1 hypothetical protein TVAGG3_0291160 [Trichomonas vaginalis G3]|eukprot:XP_001583954.1 hypothetical protein [Trichomonas vaginalis G3]
MSKIEKLVEHVRKITNETMIYAYELTDETLDKAKNTLQYAKKVQDSISQALLNEPNAEIDGQDAFIVVSVSILPQLNNAVKELEDAIQNYNPNSEQVNEEVVADQQVDDELDNLFKRDITFDKEE